MDFNVDKKEIYAVAVVLLLSVGFWHFPPKITLPEFGAALQMRNAMDGQATQLHIIPASSIAQAFGASASDPQSVVSFLLWFPSILLGLTAVFLYLACRACGFKRTISAFAAVLFAVSLTSLSFAPGIYSSSSLAALFFAIFALSFAYYISTRNVLLLIPSAALAFISGYIDPSFGIASALLALSFAVTAYLKKDRLAAQLLIIFAIAAVSAAASPNFRFLSFSLISLESGLQLSPFLLAAASCSVVLYLFESGKLEYALLSVFGLLAMAASPLAAAAVFVLPAAEGIGEAASERHSKKAKLFCAFAVAFFAFLGMSSPQLGFLKGALVSGFLASLFPMLLHFYDYRHHQFFPAIALCLFSLALFSAYLLPGLQASSPVYLDPDFSSALSQLSGKGISSVGMLSNQDAASFYLEGAKMASQSDIESYLANGNPRPLSGTYLLLSLSDVDDPLALPQAAFESYSYRGNFTSQSGRVALFSSPAGRLLLRELDNSGGAALKDASLINSAGQAYATIPLSAMLLLKPSKPMADPNNRLIVLEEGSSPPYFMKIYSGSASELSLVSEHGAVAVYRVN